MNDIYNPLPIFDIQPVMTGTKNLFLERLKNDIMNQPMMSIFLFIGSVSLGITTFKTFYNKK